jgi:KaiC/GvpD/RAD55 family RecA-like ATPase
VEKQFSGIRVGSIPRLTAMAWWFLKLIPRANLVLVEGQEGSGKGYFLCWCLVQAASGAWGAPMPGLYFSSEEEPAVIQERLLLAGYNPEKHERITIIEVNKGDALATLPLDEKAVIAIVKKYGAGMVATDLLRDHCAPTADMGITQRSNNDETWIRPAARAWQRVATRTGATVLGSHHRNKSEDGSARSKSTGSGAWRHIARLVIVLAEVELERALAVDKRNVGKRDRTVYSYDIEEVTEDIGKFVFGDALPAYDGIDHWEREKRKGVTYEMDDAREKIVLWCENAYKNGFPKDDDGDMRLPVLPDLKERTGIPRAKLRTIVTDLLHEGRLVTKKVKRLDGYGNYFWHPE